jgi:hypothetical protein
MKDKKSLERLLLAVILLLAISIPLQYLVRKEVVVGLPSDEAHSAAHEEEETNGQSNEVQTGPIIVTNFGFEVGTREQIWGWGPVGDDQGAVIYRDSEVSGRGFASASVSTNGAYVNDAGWFTKMDELPLSKDLAFSGYVKTENLRGEAYLRVICKGSLPGQEQPQILTSVSTDDRHGTTDWSLTSLECFIPPEATGIWLEVGIFGNGHAWFDDLSLEVKEKRALPTGVNLFNNPALADEASSWHIVNSPPDKILDYGQRGTGPDGSPAFAFLRSNASATDYSILYQSLSGFYEHKGTIRITGWIKCEGMNGSAFPGLRVFQADAETNFKSPDVISGNTDWVNFTMTAELTGNIEDLWFTMNMQGSGSLYISGLKAIFEETPAIQ